MKADSNKNMQPVTTTDCYYRNLMCKQNIGLKSTLSIMDDSRTSASVLWIQIQSLQQSEV